MNGLERDLGTAAIILLDLCGPPIVGICIFVGRPRWLISLVSTSSTTASTLARVATRPIPSTYPSTRSLRAVTRSDRVSQRRSDVCQLQPDLHGHDCHCCCSCTGPSCLPDE